MTLLVNIAEQMVMRQLLGNNFPITGKSKVVLAALALAAFFALGAMGMALYAAGLWVWQTYPPHLAALIMAGCLFGCALLCLLCGWGIMAYRQAKIARMKKDFFKSVQEFLITIDDELKGPIEENPKASMLIASLCGFLISQKIV